MGLLGNIFTWWDGATIGTSFFTMRKGRKMGEDELGNVYYEGKKLDGNIRRRWVIYSGANDASRVPPEWHGWLHNSYDEIPSDHLAAKRDWQKEPTGNLTGTVHAYRPAGALESGGHRAAATGDYEAWSPDNS